jgi:hypothetical protein
VIPSVKRSEPGLTAAAHAGTDYWGVQLFCRRSLEYHPSMWGSKSRVHSVQQRIALLKQQERELRILFSHSHTIPNDTEEIATKLVVLAAEIAELESAIPSKTP